MRLTNSAPVADNRWLRLGEFLSVLKTSGRCSLSDSYVVKKAAAAMSNCPARRQGLTSWSTAETYTADPAVDSTEATGFDEALTGLDSSLDRVEGKEQEVDSDTGYGAGLSVSGPVNRMPKLLTTKARWKVGGCLGSTSGSAMMTRRCRASSGW